MLRQRSIIPQPCSRQALWLVSLTEPVSLEAMASAIMAIIPAALGKSTSIIFGILALQGSVCGTDAYFYGIMPLVMQGKVKPTV